MGITGTPLTKVSESALHVRSPVLLLLRVYEEDQMVVSVGPSVLSKDTV